jgi:SAM-dependent methyltransferase
VNQRSPGPPKSLLARVLNRLGSPIGILPYPFVYEPGVPDGGRRERVFEEIYRANYWGSGESGSGVGSELRRTAEYRKALVTFLRDHSIASMFDAPCGDLNWIRLVLEEYPMRYVGGDIAESALELARRNLPGVDVRLFDICRDPLPDAEVWHCRDALFHLSFEEAWMALENAARSNVRFALVTTHRSRWLKNLDVETGGWRHLDLERAPFGLPKPLQYLRDSGGGTFPRFVGVWPIDALRAAVAARAQAKHSS